MVNEWIDLAQVPMILPESLRWDHWDQRFTLTDIHMGSLHQARLNRAGKWEVLGLLQDVLIGPVTSLNPIGQDAFVGTTFQGIFYLHRSRNLTKTENLIGPNRRFNDSLLDSQSNFWVGSKDLTGGTDRREILWKLNSDGQLDQVAEDFSLTNGIAQTTSGSVLVSDSLDYRVRSFSENQQSTGEFDESTIVDALDGEPDGLLSLEDDTFLCALWGAGKVCQFDSRGNTVSELFLPRRFPTSVAISQFIRGSRWIAVGYASHEGEPGGVLISETDLTPKEVFHEKEFFLDASLSTTSLGRR